MSRSESTSHSREQTSLLGNVDYRWWLLGDVFSLLSSGMLAFAVPLYAVLVSGSLVVGGLIASAYLIAMAACALPGGVVADRIDRRVLLAWQGGSGFLLIGAVAVLDQIVGMNVPILLVMAVLVGVRGGLFWSLTNASLKSVVTTRQLADAMSANQARDAVVGLLAAPVGGILYGVAPALPFAVSGVLSLSTVLSAWRIRADLRPHNDSKLPFLTELREGLRYTLGSEFLRSAIAVILVANLAASGLVVTVVLHLQDILVPAWRIGLVEATLGAGLLVGAALSPLILRRFTGGIIVMVGGGWMAAMFGSLAFGPYEPLIFAAMFLGGASLAPVNAVLGGYLMAVVPSSRQGKVQSIAGLGVMGLSSLAPALAGFGLAAWGYQGATLMFLLFIAVALFVLYVSRSLRTIPAARDWEAAPEIIGDRPSGNPAPQVNVSESESNQ